MELGYENLPISLQSHIIYRSPCKLQSFLHSPFKTRFFLGYNSFHYHHASVNRKICYLYAQAPPIVTKDQTHNLILNLSTKDNSSSETRVSQGFKPSKTNLDNGKKKRYGGVLPSILKSLNSTGDLKKTLNLYCGNLNPKEQTVILKEQKSWERVVRVFDWIKSQDDYVYNVIHYNVVLRALGRAQKWDELRLCWTEMAKNGILPTNNTYGMLVDVYGKAGLVKESLLWIKHMKVRGFFPDEVTMNTVVRVLKDAGEYDKAHKFYKDWCLGKIELDELDLDSIDDSQSSRPISLKHFLSTELFRTSFRDPSMKIVSSSEVDFCTQKPKMTPTYNTLIDLYGKSGRLKDAAEVFAEMLKLGVAADTTTFNTMIYTCGSHGQLSEAEILLSKMEERGIWPDTKTYNIFISLYADVGDFEGVLKCYRKIREVGLFPDVVTHRAILHILCERNMVKEVETVIEDMEERKLCIDEHSLPILIKMYVKEGLFDRANVVFEKRILKGVLSSKTYEAIIDVYGEKGLWAEAEAVFYSKRNLVGQSKDVREYNVMIKAYGKAKLYDKALSLFKGMKNQGIWPDECTYNSLIQMLSRGDTVDQARDLLSEMQEIGFNPSCQTFSSIITGYCRSSRLSDSVSVYDKMVRNGVEPNEIVYGSLIDGFAEDGRVEDALYFLKIMEKNGITANQIVLTSLIKAYGKINYLQEAKQIYEKIKSFEGGPDIVASNSMINLYADLGMVSEASSIFSELRKSSLADSVTYATMMYLYKNMGMPDEAIKIAEEMKNSGLLRDCVSFNKIMACYATNGQLIQCAKLLHEMVNLKILPDNATFKVLFTILKKANFPIEAVKQLVTCYHKDKGYSREAVIACVFLGVGLHDFAKELLENFVKPGIVLDLFAYNVAIYAYGALGEVEKALNIFMKMQDEGLIPDTVTYIYLVGCYGKAGMVEGVKRVYSLLKYGEIEPNKSLYDAVIDAYKQCKRQDLAQLVSQEIRYGFDIPQNSDSEPDYDDIS